MTAATDESEAGRAEALLAWYARVRRPLPWRFTRDPYALLVSEVMLQQTQAGRVVAYYEAFLARFPDAEALAAAPVRDVLAMWSGLGYNRRALALQAAARRVAEQGWPAPGALEELPGVGAYTAAAVASFAWDAQVAAVDTNVRRVIGRWDGKARAPRALAARAAALLPLGRAAEWNQALMELGATVCTPRAPRCAACPVQAACAGPAPAREPAERGAPGPAPAPASHRPPGSPPASHRPPGLAPASHRPPVPVPASRRAAPASRRPRERFEDSDRRLRGRIVAALVAGEPPPLDMPADRRERVLAGLQRDGLIVRGEGGSVRLP
jgi:A/G-specific adenine glycosylase